MVSEPALVGLLYRADWTKLTLSRTVTGAADFGFTPPAGLPVYDGESQQQEESGPRTRSWSWNPLG